jgi:hypothetical protein
LEKIREENLSLAKSLSKRVRKTPRWVFGVVLALIAFRIMMPEIIKNQINKKLQDLGAYTGHVEDVDLALYRLASSIQGFEIRKKNSNLPPLVRVDNTSADLSWTALTRGDISADVEVDRAVITLSDSAIANQKQLGTEQNWFEVFNNVAPVTIESLSVVNSAIHFSTADVPIPINIEKLTIQAHDLTTRPKNDLSPFTMSAEIQGHAGMAAAGHVGALSTIPPKADIDFSLKNFDFSTVNKVLRKYVPIDITKGRLDVFSEVATSNWNVIGYSKVFLKDADIIAPKQKFASGRHFIFEILGALGNWLLQNNKTKKVAFFAPFEIKNKKIAVDNGEAFWSSIENRSDALKPGIENSVDMGRLAHHELPKHKD